MEAIDALVFVIGIYVLTLVVALFVAGAIVVIRWATADRAKPAITVGERSVKAEEARA
ncbi:MAG: hypothetical protein M1358_16680 [Chloroflexi bacterium]|nr:hypothetical protein [Chloroflexota bacterium]